MSTSTFTSRGKRGTCRHRPALCATSTFTLRGRRGTWRHRPLLCPGPGVELPLEEWWAEVVLDEELEEAAPFQRSQDKDPVKAGRCKLSGRTPSGLRVLHLREAFAAGSTETLLQQLCGVVSLLAQGEVCLAVASSLAGASLVALPKPIGGVRPIAVGEILRRLTAKCLMETVRDDARQHFAPVQLGVAIPGTSGLQWVRMLLSLRTHQSGQQRRPNSSMPSVVWMTRRSASACFAPVAAISDWSTACGARRRLLSLTASRLLTKEHVLALAASRACTCTMAASCSGI